MTQRKPFAIHSKTSPANNSTTPTDSTWFLYIMNATDVSPGLFAR